MKHTDSPFFCDATMCISCTTNERSNCGDHARWYIWKKKYSKSQFIKWLKMHKNILPSIRSKKLFMNFIFQVDWNRHFALCISFRRDFKIARELDFQLGKFSMSRNELLMKFLLFLVQMCVFAFAYVLVFEFAANRIRLKIYFTFELSFYAKLS